MTQLSIRKMKEAPGEEMLLNMGPQHPSTHGVINFLVETDGEVITRAIPDVGYLHRSIEKIAEKCSYHGFMPYTDRVDYVAAMSANEGWARAVEKLLKLEVPPRGEYARVIAVELNRISSHLVALGSMAMDIGASTPFTYNLREREYINDLLEELCGARLTYNYFRIGGVMADLPLGFREKTLRFLDHFEPIVEELHRLVGGNEILVQRFAGVGTITGEEAIAYGLVGPNLRASGVDWDLRRDLPYGAYPDFDFDVPVGTGRLGELGDCLDRWDVRITEMLQSARILRQAFDKLPEGPVNAKVPRKIKTKPDEVQSRIEAARGEMAYYIVAGTGENPWRVRIRTGSFAAMTIIESKSPGMMIQDLVAFFASLDVVAPEVDR